MGRASQIVSGRELYRRFESGDIHYGPTFQAIRMLYVDASEALSEIELPAAAIPTSEDFWMHPSLLDAALQTVAAFGLSSSESEVYLPFSLTKAIVCGDPGKARHALVRRSRGARQAAGFQNFQIHLLDASGRELVRMDDLSVRRANHVSPAINSKQEVIEKSEAKLLEILRQVERGNLAADEAEQYLIDSAAYLRVA
jgi:hypothetical protein